MEYTVKAGDTLSKIARDRLGDVQLWQEIALRNGIRSPYTIVPGQVLRLTDDPPETVRRIEPGLTITAPVPANARRPMSLVNQLLLWGGLAAAAVLFLFPPEKTGLFGARRPSKRKAKGRARLKRAYR